MAVYTIQDTTLSAIADAIREKQGIVPITSGILAGGQDRGNFEPVLNNLTPGGIYKLIITPTYVRKGAEGYFYAGGNASGVKISDKVIFEEGITQEFILSLPEDGNDINYYWVQNKGYQLKGTYTLEEIDENGDSVYAIKPTEMADAINEMLIIPEEAFYLSGDCSYKFAYGSFNWLIDAVGDKMAVKDNIYGTGIFQQNASIKEIPFSLKVTKGADLNSCFYGCWELTASPEITGCAGGSKMFCECKKLLSLNNTQLSYTTSLTSIAVEDMFRQCYSLRNIGNFFDNFPSVFPGKSIYGFYRTFENCYSIDELNLPFVYSTYNNSYGFNRCFSYCFRLKELTFREGEITAANYKGATIDLSDCVGYQTTSANYLTQYGFTNNTRVVDDETYQALKDHPDYWTSLMAYSRYNHNSAVNTLNSLPDCSSLSVSNTIKFKGEAGSATDGGAINTLTEEEIAVATAKGWTVSLV